MDLSIGDKVVINMDNDHPDSDIYSWMYRNNLHHDTIFKIVEIEDNTWIYLKHDMIGRVPHSLLVNEVKKIS